MRFRRVIDGAPRTNKVECQICGKAKEEGLRCDSCGFPLIEIKPMADGRPLIFLPLCPSTNVRMRPVNLGGHARDILTDDARDYIATVGEELRRMLPLANVRPVTRWSIVWVWLILPRTNCDPHNYFKVSLDAMEKGGAFFDDKYAIPRIGGIWFDAKSPEMIVRL